MADAELERTTAEIEISTNKQSLIAKGEVIRFEGFLKVYAESVDEDNVEEEADNDSAILPPLVSGQVVDLKELTATQRFTAPSARYTEASLVKALEEKGIGRPSTYAPTISTIIKRAYVVKEDRPGREREFQTWVLSNNEISGTKATETVGTEKAKLFPTHIGTLVTDFLVENFENVVDYTFTAEMEDEFDNIAKGKLEWTVLMKNFYKSFHQTIEDSKSINRSSVGGGRELGVDPKSGRLVSVRLGKFGPMAQIGAPDDEEKKFASLMADQNIGNISLDDALKLFLLPKNLGVYKGEEIEINNGRFGPYIKFGAAFISLPKGENPTDVSLERAQELIDEKTLADAPIAVYKGEGVQKGVGRFGPFIKWNGVFINVSRKYNFDNLSQSDIEELIEDKLQKNIDKVLHDWKEEGIVVEKARWGRSVILKGKLKIELGKEIDATILSLAQVQEIIAKKTPAKKTAAKKAPAKKTLAKKAVTKKK